MKINISCKNIPAILSCICFSLFATAHERDTLKCHFDPSSVFTYTLYTDGNGGYVCGVNSYGDLEIAQKFGQAPSGDTVGTECSVPDEHQLNEVLVRFGAKIVGNPGDSVYVNVYNINHTTGGPDSLIGRSFPVQMSFIDTSVANETYTDFLLMLPVIFTDSFFLSVVLPHDAGDTLGIITSTNGQALGTQMCWKKISNGTWVSLLAGDSLDIDAVIFPVVGDATIGINEIPRFISDVKVFPNPAKENLNIDYTIVNSVRELKFVLYDISGKIVYSVTPDNFNSGNHQLNINISEFTEGSYFYSFVTDKQKYNGELKIVK